jgi:uncharacterized coiled-coil DUF342 family protein
MSVTAKHVEQALVDYQAMTEQLISTSEAIAAQRDVALAKVEELEARVEQLSLPYTKMCEQVWELQEQRDSFQRVGISALAKRDQLAELLQRAYEYAPIPLQCRIDAALSSITKEPT